MSCDRPRLHYADIGEEGITEMGTQDWDELDPEIRERIEQSFRNGVTYSIDWKAAQRPHRITAIHWRLGPGPYAVPNALADSVIRKVGKEPMDLELDGHWYQIRRHPDPPKRGKHRLKAKDADR